MLFLALIISFIISWMDLRTREVPLRVLQCGSVIAFLVHVANGTGVNAFFAWCVGYALLHLPCMLSKGRLVGAGDAWITGWMGVVLGFPFLWIALYVSILLGGVVAVVLLCFGWKRTDRVPLAPIFSASLLGTYAWGDVAILWLQQVW